MTRRQRIALWRKVSQCLDNHERKMMQQQKKDNYAEEFVKQQQEAEPWIFSPHLDYTAPPHELKEPTKQYADPLDPTFSDEPDGRWNWFGEAEEDATGMDDDLPSAAEDCAKQRGSYEI